jgi:WD40 repeat protein/MinD-like ATPase involved in chromosome partitioning or flagellar assembly
MIYTFYSYKGGVGRSMAMANVAEWFYLRGLRVVMIDWDLEAPGLESFFVASTERLTEIHSQLGLIDALLTYRRQYLRLPPPPLKRVERASAPVVTPSAFTSSDHLDVPSPPSQPESAAAAEPEARDFITVLRENLPPLSDFLYPIHKPQPATDGRQTGALWLLPSGWRAGEQFSIYAQAVQSFDWTDFYTSFEGATYFEWMREQLNDVADVVLIDSRTGVTEMGGVCTRQLANTVVSFCVPNDQNLSGVVRMIRSFIRDDVKEERQKHGHPPPQVVVIPTRIENSEDDLRQKFRDDFKRALQDVNGFKLDPEAFWKLRIPYIPKYAYAERLAIGDEAANEELVAAYERLAAYLATLALKDPVWTQRTEKARQDHLTIAAERVLGKILPRSGVFLAYALSDGEELASRLRPELELLGIEVWREPAEAETDRDRWLQVTDALGQVEYLVLVVTPGALGSDFLRRELRCARQQGVCILPVIGAAVFSVSDLPWWLRNLPIYDLGHESDFANAPGWKRFVNNLHMPCHAPRVPFMAEELPEHFVPRPAETEHLISLFVEGKRNEPRAATAAICGAGGYGKTSLALALCHDERIQDAFADGILWVTLGENPDDLTGRVADLIYVLSGERPTFTTLDAATSALAELLADRDILLVIDDVWNAEHLRPFMPGGPRGACLITTRNQDAIPQRAVRVVVDAMRRDEAVALLSAGLPEGDEPELRKLAARLGEWPLLLKLVNGTLRERVNLSQQRLADAIVYVNKALERRGLTFFDARNPTSRAQAVSMTLGASLEHLNEDERTRFTELAVFPEDADIPLTTVAKFWGATGGFDEFDTEEFCERLSRLSLLLRFDPSARLVRLHDVVRAYLLTSMPDDQRQLLHNRLLDVHRPITQPTYTPTVWPTMPPDEPYLWRHLAYHLLEAGRGEELLETVLHLPYVVSKTYLRGTQAVEADLWASLTVAPQNTELNSLLREFSRSCHILGRSLTRDELATTLYSRLKDSPELTSLTLPFSRTLPLPRIEPWRPLPDMPAPALMRTLTGHTSRVNGCAFGSDASFVVSASDDKTLKIWDALSGRERFTLAGHADGVTGCAVSPDGSFVVSASDDGTLKVWDSWSGQERMTLRGHKDSVKGCAVSPDGSFIVSASSDKTLKVWDAANGAERLTLSVHKDAVVGCAVSPDGSLIASVSADRILGVWYLQSGTAVLETFSWASSLTGCAFSPDGSVVVATSSDRTLKVLNMADRAARLQLRGHMNRVNGCAVSPDSSFVVSASNDQTLKIWDLKRGTERSTLRGHTAWVRACAVSPDGTRIVSSSNDQTLKIWNADAQIESTPQSGHTAWVRGCAVSRDGSLLVSASDDQTLKVWDVSSGEERLTLKGHKASVRGCAVSSDNSFFVSASSDRTLRVYTREGVESMTLKGHTNTVNGCAISPDSSFIVSASADQTLKVWDARGGEKRLTLSGHTDAVNGCAISPNGSSVVSVSADRTLKIWDARSGKLLQSMSGHTAPVNGCAVSPDGSFVVSASSDKTLRIWDAASGRSLRYLEGHANTVSGCAVSPDNALVASASWDRTLKVWDARSGKCVTTFQAEGVLLDCVWLPDGQHLAAGGGGGVYWLRLIPDTSRAEPEIVSRPSVFLLK